MVRTASVNTLQVALLGILTCDGEQWQWSPLTEITNFKKNTLLIEFTFICSSTLEFIEHINFYSCKIFILPPLEDSCPGRRYCSTHHPFPVALQHTASICHSVLPLRVSQFGANTNGVFVHVWMMHCLLHGTPIERNLMGWGRVTEVAKPPFYHCPSIFLHNLCSETPSPLSWYVAMLIHNITTFCLCFARNWSSTHRLLIIQNSLVMRCCQNIDRIDLVESSWNVMAHGDAREEKWRRNKRIEWGNQ